MEVEVGGWMNESRGFNKRENVKYPNLAFFSTRNNQNMNLVLLVHPGSSSDFIQEVEFGDPLS